MSVERQSIHQGESTVYN